MFATILMLLTGLTLSGVAAWFSVVGLIAIFSAAPLSVMIMGGTLEVAKLVCASWVYNNWNVAPRAMKAYLSAAVVMLMFITSMGIFGYLSKAHLEQRAATSDTSLQLERVEQEISVKEAQLARLQGTEDRLNRAVDALIEKDRVSQALAQRQRMQRELRSVAAEKKGLQADIDKLYEEKIPLDVSNRKVEAEIGPLKYIAELIYGEQAKSHFDEAVRAVIIILIVVFDPLAVIMLIAANFGMAEHRKKKLEPITVPNPVTEPKIVDTVAETPVEEVVNQVAEEPVPPIEPTVIEEPVELSLVQEESTAAEVSPLVLEMIQDEPLSKNLVWDPTTKSWQPDSEELEWRRNISRRFERLTPEFVSLDGKLYNQNELPAPQEIMSLETVKNLMHRLTNEEMTVDDLSWAECEAILKYLGNDKPTNIA